MHPSIAETEIGVEPGATKETPWPGRLGKGLVISLVAREQQDPSRRLTCAGDVDGRAVAGEQADDLRVPEAGRIPDRRAAHVVDEVDAVSCS